LLLADGTQAQRDEIQQRAEAARKQGLKGYDFVDAVDVFYGRMTPDFHSVSSLLDGVGNRNGRVDMADWKKIGLPKEHFHYFDKDSDGRLSDDEAMWWFMQRKGARDMDLSEVKNPPKGHLQRLGSWKEPLSNEGLVYEKPYPHPREFWKEHMDKYKPALLKGAQDGWPAMEWTPEVLRERFGWVDCKLEPKTEGRGNNTAYRELERLAPGHRLNISEYLRVEEGKNIYVVSIVPQEMAWEVAHPSVLLCGSRKVMATKASGVPYKLTEHEYPHENGHMWMTHLFEANLWISTGRTRSQFHYDKEWNVNCLLSGRKRWVFMNPFDIDEDVQWARGEKFNAKNPLNNAWTDWLYIDPDNVDLIVQNKLRNMDYYEMYQEAGDCIFIPYAMLHQVEKLDDGLQVAVSWMFLPETVYDEEACTTAPIEEDLPLAVMDTLYMYLGTGLIPQGYKDPLHFRNEIQKNMEQSDTKHLNLKTLTEMVTQGGAILGSIRDRKQKIKALHQWISSYADDPKKGLRADELTKVPLRIWCKPAAEGDDEGPLPCDRDQELHLAGEDEFKKMQEFVQGALAKQTPRAAVPNMVRLEPGMRAARRVWKSSKAKAAKREKRAEL